MKKKLLLTTLLLSTLSLKADEFIGIIKPIHDVKISVPLDGIVQSIYVKEGSYVKKGQKILKLENQLQQLEVNRRKIIWKDKAQLNASIENQKIQKRLFNSTKELYEQTRAVSEQEVQLLESKLYTLKGDIAMRKENEKKEKIEYNIAQKLLSKYLIKSPINGVVIEMGLQRGEWAKSGKPFVRIVNTYTCYIDINIDEAYSSKLKVGKKINFTVKTKNVTAKKKGKIIFISPVADMASGLVRIKIEFLNKKNRVTPGLSATINIDAFSKNKRKEP
jgi:RND family efflux transporter MFP subunit